MPVGQNLYHPTHVPAPTPPSGTGFVQFSPLDQTSLMMLAGYRDCAQEAIRYLLDVEKLSIDDPLVVGLRMHLHEHQKSIDIHQMLYGHYGHPGGHFVDTMGGQYHHQGLLSSPSPHWPHWHVGGMAQSIMAADTDIHHQPIAEHVRTATPSAIIHPVASVDSETNSSTALDLGLLQGSNAAIANLAEEILSLLEEGESFSDCESDDEYEYVEQ
jgi:hypothetical protein